MRLLIISSEFPPGPGGIGTHAFKLASELTRLHVDVMVLSPQDYSSESEVTAFTEQITFKLVRLKHSSSTLLEALSRWWHLRSAVKNFQPQVILATGARSVWITAVTATRLKIPWVAVGHGTEFGVKGRLELSLTRLAFVRANSVICVSKYTQVAMQNLGINPPKTIVIHNGADSRQYQPASEDEIRQLRAKWNLRDRFVIVTVGNVTPRKGQEIVIRALPEITKKIPETVYLMAGLPTIQDQLEDLATQLGIGNKLRFLGRVGQQELVELYKLCDLFVMTSRHTVDGDFEGFGIAVIEAALCGKPAVVSGGSGLEEAVIDGCTGLVVHQVDTAATARSVIRLYHDIDLRLTMGLNAQQRAANHYGWDKVAKQYMKVFQELEK